MKGKAVLFSKSTANSGRDEWGTPDGLFNDLNNVHHFTLDACGTVVNAKLDHFYSPQDDGLAQSWIGETVFVNPPFSQTYKWVEKAWVEMTVNKVKTVMLLPARTDVKWFHNFIYNLPHISTQFLKGRIKFKGADHGAPFPSMIVIFDPNLEILHVEYRKE